MVILYKQQIPISLKYKSKINFFHCVKADLTIYEVEFS